MSKNLCIIPARGGSKRIPGKNVRNFLGKPIIAYSIEAALQSGIFDVVMVSTDDDEIAAIAEKYGAVVPFKRSADNADDHSSLADVVDEVIAAYKNIGVTFDFACTILATAPLIQVKYLKLCYDKISEPGSTLDSVRLITPFSFPVQKAVRFDGAKTELIWPEYRGMRSQDLEPAYHDAAQFYWFLPETGMRGKNNFRFVIPNIEVQDIDTPVDWALAEMKYKLLNSTDL